MTWTERKDNPYITLTKIQILELKVEQDNHDQAELIVQDLVQAGGRILSTAGHKSFVLGYEVFILISNITITQTFIQDHGKIFSKIAYHDLNQLIEEGDEGTVTPPEVQQSGDKFGFTTFHTLQSINSHLEALCAKYPHIMEMVEMDGETYEGRKIRGVRITRDVKSAASRNKPMIYLEGGLHSREWISPATLMYLIEALVGEKEADKSAQAMAVWRRFQIVLMPVVNPDGYVYSQVDRLWRKTRKPAGCKFNLRDCNGECLVDTCIGVDPNRNWDIDFGVLGSSSEPCDASFPGRAPFDQECTVVLRDFLVSHREKLVLSVSYHSYGQMFLYPWGHTKDPTPHLAHHTKVGRAFSRAVAERNGTVYKYHPISNIYHDMYPENWYEVSGTSIDWVYHHLGVVDSYAVELSPVNPEVGFLLPPERIVPTGEENWDGLLAVVRNIAYRGAL